MCDMVSELLPPAMLTQHFETVTQRCLRANLAHAVAMTSPRPFCGYESPGASSADTSLVDLFRDLRGLLRSEIQAEMVSAAQNAIKRMMEETLSSNDSLHTIVHLKVATHCYPPPTLPALPWTLILFLNKRPLIRSCCWKPFILPALPTPSCEPS